MAATESKIMLNGTLKRLVALSVMSEEDAKEATVTAKKRKVPLFTYLVENKLAPSETLANIASTEYGVPQLDISAMDLTSIPLTLKLKFSPSASITIDPNSSPQIG